ncbi:type II secretion system protein F [Desertihabitans brevis]|uniref:Type II secretion system protein F n=1 Tax=Desertihabitans brevis TaxID=2268447 RepID=A0A367YU59_9ACTN|nr:type II secretion system F family protein [Desertihabitans brevis]RCK69297.1 type II secretion system protein F [Desertihabitans brevis]
MTWTATLGVAACAVALLLAVWALLAPGPARLPLARRRPGAQPDPTLLSAAATRATGLVERPLRSRGLLQSGAAALEQAGVKMRPQDAAVLIVVGMVVALAAGSALAGPLLGLALAVAVPLVTKAVLGILAGRRQKAFADQLEDSLQLMAGSLRAGHSMLQALDSVSREAEHPTSEEFARIINENRVGRELGAALEDTARRMGSEDFDWVTQAIAINREVGGNLAEVLDQVAGTIRERAQIRRQVRALSAEGRLSAYVLMALPVCIVAFLSVASPGYLAGFTSNVLGYAMIAVSVVLMGVGALWLRKATSITF